MPYTDYPVWKLSPNWGKGVLERLEWKTDVLESEAAAEQRIPRRLTPRRYLETSFLVEGKNRAWLDSFRAGVGANDFLIPLWHDVSRLEVAVNPGDDLLQFDTLWREYAVGTLLILRNPRTLAWEVGEVAVLEDDSIGLQSPLEGAWPAGTYVHPARLAKVTDETQALKITDRAVQHEIRFMLSQDNPNESLWYSTNDYMGTPILSTRPDESEDLTKEYQRLFALFDTGDGVSIQADTAGKDLNTVQYRWGLKGRQKLAELRKILHYVRGKNRAFWLPSFMDDLKLISNIDMLDSTIRVQNIEYTKRGLRQSGVRDFQMVLHDGFIIQRRIIDSAVISDDIEELTLDAPLFADVAVADVKEFSFLFSRRLNQDVVELSHPTDIDGTTHCTVGMKMAEAGSYWMTSKLYAISPMDAMDWLGEFGPEGRLPIPRDGHGETDPMDWIGSLEPTGLLRSLLQTYAIPPEDMDWVGSIEPTGTLRALLQTYVFPAEDMDWVGSIEPSGTLRVLLITYGNWPAEAVDFVGNLEPTGTLV